MEEVKGWDKFVQSEYENTSASEKNESFIKKASIALKILTIIVVSIVVIICSCLAKGTYNFTYTYCIMFTYIILAALLFIVAQAQNQRTLKFCKDELSGNALDPNTDYFVVYDEVTSVAYLWQVKSTMNYNFN